MNPSLVEKSLRYIVGEGFIPMQPLSNISIFLMSDLYRENVEAFIAFEKRKADPRNIKAEAEATLSDPSTWGVYAIWITGGAGFAYVKNVIIEPKYRSGEWEEIRITLPGSERFAQAAADAAAAADVAQSGVVDTASSVVDVASAVVDAASAAM